MFSFEISHVVQKVTMKRISKMVLLSAALCILGIVLSTELNDRLNAAAVALPFHAVIQGNANPSPIDSCTLANRETGSGTALHLGAITWSDNEVAQFLFCSVPNPPTNPAIDVSGQFTIVAANADEIHGEFQTKGTFDPVNGVSVSGRYTFTSGTGRFSNVTGTGIIAASGGASPPFEFVGSLDGTLNYGGGQ